MQKIKLSELKNYELHKMRKQMVLMPAFNVADDLKDLDEGEKSINNEALQMSIAENGVLEAVVICGKSIVDGERRLSAAQKVLAPDTEIPVIEISDEQVVNMIVANIMHSRALTKQQRIFNIYQFIRQDHIFLLEFAANIKKANLNNSAKIVINPRRYTDGTVEDARLLYFPKYIEYYENTSENPISPLDWFALTLGVARNYLIFLDRIWRYFEEFDESSRTAEFNEAVRFVNIEGKSLNQVLPSLKGRHSTDNGKNATEEEHNVRKKQWLEKCKSSFKGLAEKLNMPMYMDETSETREAIYKKLKEAGFNRTSSAVMMDAFRRLYKEITDQSR